MEEDSYVVFGYLNTDLHADDIVKRTKNFRLMKLILNKIYKSRPLVAVSRLRSHRYIQNKEVGLEDVYSLDVLREHLDDEDGQYEDLDGVRRFYDDAMAIFDAAIEALGGCANPKKIKPDAKDVCFIKAKFHKLCRQTFPDLDVPDLPDTMPQDVPSRKRGRPAGTTGERPAANKRGRAERLFL